MFSRADLGTDLRARRDGVVGRRRRIVDADRVAGDLQMAGPRRRHDAEAAADWIDAGRRALVALDLHRLVAAAQIAEEMRPAPCRPCRPRRLGGADRLSTARCGDARSNSLQRRRRGVHGRRPSPARGAWHRRAAPDRFAPGQAHERERRRDQQARVRRRQRLVIGFFLGLLLRFVHAVCTSAGIEPVVRRCRTRRSPRSCRSRPCGRGRPARSS